MKEEIIVKYKWQILEITILFYTYKNIQIFHKFLNITAAHHFKSTGETDRTK